jgi:hypothetical protein
MGVAFYPVFEDGSGGWTDHINGKCLAQAADVFDAPCKKALVPTLLDFFSMSRETMIAELLGGDPDDPASYDETKLSEEQWHDAALGVKTVRLLLEFAHSNASLFTNYDCVREDLEAFERQLTLASEQNIRWHLGIDY